VDAIGLGIDIVEIRRVRDLLERHAERFLERVYTPLERERAAGLRDPASFLAGRFALKESVLKVLGTGLSAGISWQEIHVIREESGAPRVLLSGKALEQARRLGIGRILASISHGEEHAVAQALGLAGDPEAIVFAG
jgi:holo-[acyl-carrier protein] synthase